MASPSNDNDETIPSSNSPGNAGSRGSPGQANRGAHPADSTNQGGTRPGAQQQGPDLRKDEAQGGGGAGSESSRSR